MTRRETHDAGVRYVASALRRRGCLVHVQPGNDPVSLVAAGSHELGLSVAVRTATPAIRRHAVRVNGKRYVYEYPHLSWNLHVHGARNCQPDVWVLVTVERKRRVFVVPADVIGATAKTAQLLDTAGAVRRSRAWLRQYLGRWDVVAGGERRKERAA